jgi:hypothetical protein
LNWCSGCSIFVAYKYSQLRYATQIATLTIDKCEPAAANFNRQACVCTKQYLFSIYLIFNGLIEPANLKTVIEKYFVFAGFLTQQGQALPGSYVSLALVMK